MVAPEKSRKKSHIFLLKILKFQKSKIFDFQYDFNRKNLRFFSRFFQDFENFRKILTFSLMLGSEKIDIFSTQFDEIQMIFRGLFGLRTIFRLIRKQMFKK